MTLPKFDGLNEEFESLNEIENKILDLKRNLAELRLRKATRKSFKSHEFKFVRRKIAQLNLLKTDKKFL